MKLIYKIILPIILIIGLSVFFVGFLSLRSIKSGLYQEEFLRFQDSILKNRVSLDPAYFSDSFPLSVQNKFEEFFDSVNMPAIARFIIWDTKQTAIFSDLKSLIGFYSPGHKDILRVINTGKAFFELKSIDYNEPVQGDIGDFLDVYAPLELNGQIVGVVEAHLVLESLVSPVNSQLKTIIAIMSGGGLLMLVSILLILRAFVIKPVNNLEKASREISKGNLAYLLSSFSTDEIGNLTRDFDKMRQALKLSIDNLEKEQKLTLKKSLELEKQNKLLSETGKAVMNLLEDGKILEENLKEERERLNAVIFSMGEGLIVVDSNLKVILINSTAEKLLEVSSEKAVGGKITDIVSLLKGEEKVLTEDLPVIKTLKTGEIIEIDLEDNCYYQLPSGKKFPVIFIDTPLRGDGITGAVVVFRDITDEKRLDESKTNFISISSHQLRTPLTAIKWFSEILLDDDEKTLNTEQKDYIGKIAQSAERMVNLVNLLLQIARVEMGRLNIESIPVDLRDLTQKMIASVKNILILKSQEVEIKTDPSNIPLVPMDKEIIWQVIMNLLTNASRYSPVGGVITISIVLKNQFVEYSVKDSGIGIPENQKALLFAKFFRASNAVKAVPEGSGLGLFLVKSLVEGWGGKIWFESVEGKGATFYFTVPLEGVKSKKGEVTLKV